MSEHTPGPWTYSGREVIDQWGGRILLTGVAITCGRNDDHETAQANSRLIAAAPDLLSELSMLCERVERARDILRGQHGGNWGMLCTDSARIFIAKATEGQS